MSETSSLPFEMTVPVEVLFASTTAAGLLLDCTLIEEFRVEGAPVIPAGAPFTLRADPDEHTPTMGALATLRRWCDENAPVLVTTSSKDRRLVLRHHDDELVLLVA